MIGFDGRKERHEAVHWGGAELILRPDEVGLGCECLADMVLAHFSFWMWRNELCWLSKMTQV